MINRHPAHLWHQMKIHRILTHVCLLQIGCLCYCCYAKTSSSAVQKRHSKVYGNPIAPSFYSIISLIKDIASLNLRKFYAFCRLAKDRNKCRLLLWSPRFNLPPISHSMKHIGQHLKMFAYNYWLFLIQKRCETSSQIQLYFTRQS